MENTRPLALTKIPSAYIPLQSNLPALKVPEYRLDLANYWCGRQNDHPNNFACLSYWMQQCEGEGAEY